MARLGRGLPQKQEGIKIVTRIPSGADGKAGDMRLLARSSVEGAVLYVKSGNKWFPFQSGIDTGKAIITKPLYDSGWVNVTKDADYNFDHNLNSQMLRLTGGEGCPPPAQTSDRLCFRYRHLLLLLLGGGP